MFVKERFLGDIMIYFCNEETIDTTSKEMYQLQGLDGRKTKDGTCYQKESEVFKIYYSNLNILLDETSWYKLTKILSMMKIILTVVIKQTT